MHLNEVLKRAADIIEKYPERFEFVSTLIPEGEHDCGTPGCALGWIGAVHPKRPATNDCENTVPQLLEPGLSAINFYGRMDRLAFGWRSNPRICAAGLRKYADAFHPVEEEKTPLRVNQTGLVATG